MAADRNIDAAYFLLACLALGRATGSPSAIKPRNTQTRTNPRSSLKTGLSFCFVAAFHNNNNNNNNIRPPGAYRAMYVPPRGLLSVVFCGSASHSLPLFVCNMIAHRRWCFASCLATKIEEEIQRKSRVREWTPQNDPRIRAAGVVTTRTYATYR